MVERESYMKIAQEAFDKGFITFSSFARNIYKKNIEDFLEFYKKYYDNAFTKKIEIINDIHIINSKEELTNKRRIFAKENTDVFILYGLISKKKQFTRIGISGHPAAERLVPYLSESFGFKKKGITNLHLDIRALGDPNKFNLKGKRLIETMLGRIFGKYVQNRDSITQIREFVRTHNI